MVCTRKRLNLCLALLLMLLAVIWGNSLLHGELSKKISGFFGGLVNDVVPDANVESGEEGHRLLRKVGHLTEFCALGVLLSWLVRMTLKETWQHLALPLIGGIAVGSVDETIQYFVPGRACRISDVGIDTLGCTLGIVIITLILTIKNQKLKETKQ